MILVTGANGFIGKALCIEFISRNLSFRGVVRKLDSSNESIYNKNLYELGDINKDTLWDSALRDIKTIIHCASPSQFLNNEVSADDFRIENLQGIRNLMEQAVPSGVKRLVFISSIKVNGQRTNNLHDNDSGKEQKFKFTDLPSPKDTYAISKWEAEQAIWEISKETSLEVVIVRPPLVYGPYVKGNLDRLLRLVKIGIPLPLGAIRNKRSYIGLDNLVDILICCIECPTVIGQTLLVSDGEDLSTPDLINHMADALGRSARLFSVPIPILLFAAKVLNKRDQLDRLLDSLQIDNHYANKLLNWKPKFSVNEGLQKMVQIK